MMLFNKLLILCVKCKLLGSKPLNMGTRSSARSPSPLKRPGVLPLPSGIVGHPLPQHMLLQVPLVVRKYQADTTQ